MNKEAEAFLGRLVEEISRITGELFVGCYLHGSLAMGGFRPGSSDVDVLAVTAGPLSASVKAELTACCLQLSGNPFPVEISVLNETQLTRWRHPFPFEFHFSEAWRVHYEAGKEMEVAEDPDLAAHIMVTNRRGRCLAGKPAEAVFPEVPREDYLASIMGDFEECLREIEQRPVYGVLNMLRVYWYLKDGTISSKAEAGEWGASVLPEKFHPVIREALRDSREWECQALRAFADFMEREVGRLLNCVKPVRGGARHP